MMLPSNPRFAELKAVPIFNGVQVVANVMRDAGLQFPDKALKHAHLDNGHESGIFQGLDVPRDGREVVVKAGKAPVRAEFAFKMVSSHESRSM